jgi:beta-N-acetylhexosaminidase
MFGARNICLHDIKLILSLQHIAHQSGYQDPLLIITDQENGGVNSIFDSTYIHQFPSAMGIITSNSPDMAFEVASATGQELSCLGVNWITGPVLDVLSNTRTQPLGVRSLGDDPQEVARYGMKFMEGYHDAGLATCGKHFPSYGNLEFLGSPLDMPTISETIDQLRLGALVPYSIAIKYGLDAMMIGACAMPNFVEGEDITYACLSHAVVSGLLRQEMGFNGVVMSECLEIESLYDSLGVGQAVCAGVCAGCDIFLICNSLPNQLEAMSGLRAGVSNGLVSFDQLQASAARIGQLKKRYTSWEKALNPEGTVGLERLRAKHEELSKRSYDASICVVRDQGGFIPLSTNISAQQALLLLTPLVALFHGTGDTQDDDRTLNFGSPESLRRVAWDTGKTYLEGETTFRQLGLSIAKQWPGKVLHTSYTASGMRPLHEGLVSSTSAVIVLTADANRNTYQYGFVKYVSTICRGQASAELPNGKPCIVVAVSSPYDFFKDVQIGTYVCTFDFTEQALDCLVRTLTGELKPSGIAPGMKPRSKQLETRRGKQKLRQTWLVEDFNEERDMEGLQQLLDTIYVASNGSTNGPDAGHLVSAISAEWFLTGTCPLVEHKHFIVRNSSTKVLYGFCATYTLPRIGRGSIGLILVDPQRRRMGIGHWLHRRASIHMRAQPGLQDVQFGSSFPALCPGVPLQPQPWSLVLQKWATER